MAAKHWYGAQSVLLHVESLDLSAINNTRSREEAVSELLVQGLAGWESVQNTNPQVPAVDVPVTDIAEAERIEGLLLGSKAGEA